MKVHIAALALRLLWSPNTEPDFSHYIVFTGENPSQFSAYQTTTDTFFAALESGRFYAVKAVDSAGNASDFSEYVQFKESPAMSETLNVTNKLRFRLEFSLAYEATDAEKLKIEHLITTTGFAGAWRTLSYPNDWTLIQSDIVEINVTNLRFFLDSKIVYWLQVRMSYDGGDWVTHDEILWLPTLKKGLNNIIPFTDF